MNAEGRFAKDMPTRNMKKFGLVLILVTALLLLGSCRPEPVSPGDARILILSPSSGSAIRENKVSLSVFVDLFRIVDKNGKANVPGEGHMVYYMDTAAPIKAGETALTEPGSYSISIEKTHTWEGVSAGPHTFWVQLVNNDNTPLYPAVAAYVMVTVK